MLSIFSPRSRSAARLRAAREEDDVVPGRREPPAEIAADGPGRHHPDTHVRSSIRRSGKTRKGAHHKAAARLGPATPVTARAASRSRFRARAPTKWSHRLGQLGGWRGARAPAGVSASRRGGDHALRHRGSHDFRHACRGRIGAGAGRAAAARRVRFTRGGSRLDERLSDEARARSRAGSRAGHEQARRVQGSGERRGLRGLHGGDHRDQSGAGRGAGRQDAAAAARGSMGRRPGDRLFGTAGLEDAAAPFRRPHADARPDDREISRERAADAGPGRIREGSGRLR